MLFFLWVDSRIFYDVFLFIRITLDTWAPRKKPTSAVYWILWSVEVKYNIAVKTINSRWQWWMTKDIPALKFLKWKSCQQDLSQKMTGTQAKRCPRKSKQKLNRRKEDRSWRRLNSMNIDCWRWWQWWVTPWLTKYKLSNHKGYISALGSDQIITL